MSNQYSNSNKRLISFNWNFRRKLRRIPWGPVIWGMGMMLLGFMYFSEYFGQTEIHQKLNQISANGLPKGFRVNTPYCSIPDMDAFDPSIKKFIKPPPRVICNKGIPPLFKANYTSVGIIPESIGYYNVADLTNLKCCYKAFWRIEPTLNKVDRQYKFSEDCQQINESATIQDEFIKVTCTYLSKEIYKDFFSFVPLKTLLGKTGPISPPKLNVLVMGLDAVSRLNLHRQMPKTVEYLKHIGSVEMLGYNKVADNTFPNLMPVLAGLSEKDLTKACWPNKWSRFDDCDFIWKKYKSKGYVTAFGETSSWMGLFHLEKEGFNRQPTDYAYSYFNTLAESELGNSHPIDVNECVGGRMVHKDFLEYINKFLDTMHNNRLPYFAFFWEVALSHDDVNHVSRGDEDYVQFFRGLYKLGYLQNTALVFLSDHGIRIGDIRKTYQGSLEERLPFVFVALPDWFKSQYLEAYENVRKNAGMLTSPFDLHETLLDLTDLTGLVNRKVLQEPKSSRGVSLFRRISESRDCADAGIVEHWCACLRSKKVDKNSPVVKEVADFVVSYINSLLDSYDLCATLSLEAVLDARLLIHSRHIVNAANRHDHTLILRTSPGKAEFEATVRHDKETNTYSAIGTISRLTLYKDQSACIHDVHLKLYCYCKVNSSILSTARSSFFRKIVYQGSLEKRLPFLFVALPNWFKPQYPEAYENLRKTAGMLTSPFDLHEAAGFIKPYWPVKSQSIARTKEVDRNAGIVEHWCACLRSKKVDKNSPAVKEVADFVVSYINSLLDSLEAVLDARLLTHSRQVVDVANRQDHTLILRTSPGKAEFEATVRHDKETNSYFVVATITDDTHLSQEETKIFSVFLRLCKFG
nr:unnamed protein product [Callosobruchus analis]